MKILWSSYSGNLIFWPFLGWCNVKCSPFQWNLAGSLQNIHLSEQKQTLNPFSFCSLISFPAYDDFFNETTTSGGYNRKWRHAPWKVGNNSDQMELWWKGSSDRGLVGWLEIKVQAHVISFFLLVVSHVSLSALTPTILCLRELIPGSGKEFSITKVLPSGIYHFHFIVDGQRRNTPELPLVYDDTGYAYNVLDLKVTLFFSI